MKSLTKAELKRLVQKLSVAKHSLSALSKLKIVDLIEIVIEKLEIQKEGINNCKLERINSINNHKTERGFKSKQI